jgi:putative two-component system response regulator
LLVDDSSNSLRRLSAILSPEYDIRMAKEGRAALKLVENDKPDLILLDILMPGMDGFEVLARLKENPETGKIPVIFITGLAEERDSDTGYHLYRTQHYVRVLASALRDHPRFWHYLNDKTVDLLYKSAPLHDIGKIGVPDGILLKPGRLTAEERKTMERHPVIGRDAIRNAEERLGHELDFLVYAKEIIYCHHEKWDGTGYPGRIAGDAIPVSARLMALADVYDALVSRRIYKSAFSHAEARQIILAGSGSHFDQDVVTAFLEKEQEFIEISRRFADN